MQQEKISLRALHDFTQFILCTLLKRFSRKEYTNSACTITFLLYLDFRIGLNEPSIVRYSWLILRCLEVLKILYLLDARVLLQGTDVILGECGTEAYMLRTHQYLAR